MADTAGQGDSAAQLAEFVPEARIAVALEELTDWYGEPPEPVLNLLEVARLRTAARRAGLTDITAAGQHIRFAPVELPDSRQVRVQRLDPKTVLKSTVRTMLVPVPKTAPSAGSHCGILDCWLSAVRSSGRYSPTRRPRSADYVR